MKTITKKAAKKAAPKKEDAVDKDLLLSFWHHINENSTSKAAALTEGEQEQFINDFLTKQTALPTE